MADVQQLETTSSTTTTTTKTATTTITNVEEFDLELSLGFRPSKNLLEPINNNNHVVSKREEQAIRRHEAKVKRDLKRKVAVHNGVVIEEENGFERRRKVASFSCGGGGNNNGGGFRPYKGHNGKFNEVDAETRSSISTGSSSGVSDYNNNNYHSNNNSSATGGSSSDASSHSSQPPLHRAAPNVPTTNISQAQPYSSSQETQLNTSNLNVSQPQLYSSSSNQTELLRSLSQPSRSLEKTISGNIVAPPSENLSKGKSSSDKELTPTPRSPSPKDTKVVIGKPPKPNGQTSQQKAALPQMPCVSATGNGPTGKTITGFLYKYSKTEVSIVCVCHGTSFTPAGFVEHAGGVDIENPLRHIRVVPFGL